MIFRCDGQTHDTGDMHVIYTGGSHPHSLYVTPDHRHVYVLQVDHEGVTMHAAPRGEVIYLAQRFSDPHLAKAAELAKGAAAGRRPAAGYGIVRRRTSAASPEIRAARRKARCAKRMAQALGGIARERRKVALLAATAASTSLSVVDQWAASLAQRRRMAGMDSAENWL